jgi:hypothetical protein
MKVTKQNNEIIVKIPNDIDAMFLQKILDYLKAKAILSKSKGTDKDVKKIVNDIEADWWKKNKKRVLG